MTYRRKHIKPKIKTLQAKGSFLKRFLFFSCLTIVIILVGAAFYLMFFSSQFEIKNISIMGTEKISPEEIKKVATDSIDRKLFSVFSTNSIFFINQETVIKDILNAFAPIESVAMEKKWPQEIVLNVKERKPVATFCQAEECFITDSHGIIFEKTQVPLQDVLLIRRSESLPEIFAGKEVVNESTMQGILKVQNTLKNNFQIDVREVLISNFLIFTTTEGWQIYFDQNADMNLQTTKMNALLESEISITTRQHLQYIYLQYKDRAYYK